MGNSGYQALYKPSIQDRAKSPAGNGNLDAGGDTDYDEFMLCSPSKRFVPRKIPLPVTEHRLDILETARVDGILDTVQYCDLHTDGSPQAVDEMRRELRALFDAQLLIRLHSDINQPLLYKLSPLGGKVLYEAGIITEKHNPKRARLDASDVYWEHRLMRGNLRVALTKLFRENSLPVPDWQGSLPFTVNKTPPQKVFPDDFFTLPIRPQSSGFRRALAVETHNWGKAKKAAEKMAVYDAFSRHGGLRALGVQDFRVLFCVKYPGHVNLLRQALGSPLAWMTQESHYTEQYQSLVRPIWTDAAGQLHMLFEPLGD